MDNMHTDAALDQGFTECRHRLRGRRGGPRHGYDDPVKALEVRREEDGEELDRRRIPGLRSEHQAPMILVEPPWWVRHGREDGEAHARPRWRGVTFVQVHLGSRDRKMQPRGAE